MRKTVNSSSRKEAVIRDLLSAASLPRLRNGYTIGPYDVRVNFASQQARALNLVWALKEQKKINKGDEVAVIGAGLAGLTASAALVASGFKVSLFEAHTEPLFTQRNAHHRFVHPSVNFWPKTKTNPTTSFPFFDWFAGSCSEIAKEIVDEWDVYFSKHVKPHFGETAEYPRMNGQKLEFEVVKTDVGKLTRGPFDAVLLATGFGQEVQVKGSLTPSYWRADALEEEVDSLNRNYVVGGCGDGALIDAFRLIFGNNFELGLLVVRFCGFLSNPEVASTIEIAESECSDLSLRQAAPYLNSAYEEALECVPETALRFLDSRIKESMRGKVILIADLPAPFSKYTAPIHKLILRYLLKKRLVSFTYGNIIECDNNIIRAESDGEAKEYISDAHIIRVGPKSSLDEHLDVNEIFQLKVAQRAIEITNRSFWSKGRIRLPGRGSSVPKFGSSDFVVDRCRRSRRMLNLFPQYTNISWAGTPDDGFFLIGELAPNASIRPDEYVPGDLFGIEFLTRPTPRMKAL